jgi:hypothetical protein
MLPMDPIITISNRIGDPARRREGKGATDSNAARFDLASGFSDMTMDPAEARTRRR